MTEIEIKNPKTRLKALLNGYDGYLIPKNRLKSCDIFEKLILEKVGVIHSFFSKKYDEFVLVDIYHHILIPLSETIKLFAECKEKLTYQRIQFKYFFEEFRFSLEKENELCDIDYEVLKCVGIIVDKITSFNLSNENYLLKLNESVLSLKENIIKRQTLITALNSEYKQINDELSLYFREIKDKLVTPTTYESMFSLLKKYPNRILTYKEMFNCFRTYSSLYFVVHENISILSLYKISYTFVEQYEIFTSRLKSFTEKFTSICDEETECLHFLKERLSVLPDFAREKKLLNTFLQNAEAKASKKKRIESIYNKASVMFDAGLDMENRFNYIDAINFYNSSLFYDKDYSEAVDGLKRIEKKKLLISDFQNANKLFASAKFDKALEIYQKLISQNPDFEEAKIMISHLKKL